MRVARCRNVTELYCYVAKILLIILQSYFFVFTGIGCWQLLARLSVCAICVHGTMTGPQQGSWLSAASISLCMKLLFIQLTPHSLFGCERT